MRYWQQRLVKDVIFPFTTLKFTDRPIRSCVYHPDVLGYQVTDLILLQNSPDFSVLIIKSLCLLQLLMCTGSILNLTWPARQGLQKRLLIANEKFFHEDSIKTYSQMM